jgi:hypothetical protein
MAVIALESWAAQQKYKVVYLYFQNAQGTKARIVTTPVIAITLRHFPIGIEYLVVVGH